jgi:hypothetical protein
MQSYKIENWPAILLAGACWLLCTGFALEKVMTDGVSSVTLLIAMPVLTLAVVVLLHMGLEYLKQWNPMGLVAIVLGFAALAVTLPASIGSSGAARDNAVAAAGKSVEDAARIRADYAQTQRLVAEAEQWSAKECASGKGKKCEGVTFVLNQRRASLEKLESQIKALPPVKAALSGESRMAWALSKAGLSMTEADIQMAWPMLPPMVLEFLSAFFGVVGLRRESAAGTAHIREEKRTSAVAANENAVDQPSEKDRAQTSFPEVPADVAASTARRMPKMEGKGLLSKAEGWKYSPMRLN